MQAAERMEVKLHQYVMQFTRLLNHLDATEGVYNRAEIFADIESETEDMLCPLVILKMQINAEYEIFRELRKEVLATDVN